MKKSYMCESILQKCKWIFSLFTNLSTFCTLMFRLYYQVINYNLVMFHNMLFWMMFCFYKIQMPFRTVLLCLYSLHSTDDPQLTNKKGSRAKSFFKRGCSYIEGHLEGSYPWPNTAWVFYQNAHQFEWLIHHSNR